MNWKLLESTDDHCRGPGRRIEIGELALSSTALEEMIADCPWQANHVYENGEVMRGRYP